MQIKLVKVDYHDGLGGAIYYICHSITLKREPISKDAFTQILNAAKNHTVNVYPWEQCTTNELFLDF